MRNNKNLQRYEKPFKEETCKNCGKCCHYKIRFMGKVYIDLSKPCEYLDTKTNKCTVYERRLETQPLCLPLRVAIDNEVMPKDCGYIVEWKEAGLPYKDPIIVDKMEFRP